jgi:very-short-patch-repair endonuclease
MHARANIARARALRHTLTPPEARLWLYLKSLRPHGHHFRCQSPFRGYVLDFVCNRSRLVIEIDSAHHASRLPHDQTRDTVLAREGYRTLRLPAQEVLTNLEGVTTIIRQALANSPQ